MGDKRDFAREADVPERAVLSVVTARLSLCTTSRNLITYSLPNKSSF